MKEITGNLRRDVKDLLGESANLVTGFFKRGVCTVRAVADKWKAFARDISNAVDTLMEPPFVGNGSEAPAQELDPAAEPVVTVMESEDSRFPVGMKLPLSQANDLVDKADMEQREKGRPPMPLQVKIDYTKDGRTDRYWLPLEIGAGGDLLTQMQKHIDRYLTSPEEVARLFQDVPEQYQGELRTTFAPLLEQSLRDLSMNVLSYFRRHCDISTLERTSVLQAQALPEAQRESLLTSANLAVKTLRRAANTGQQQSSPQQERYVPPQREPQRKNRSSVKLKLAKIKASQSNGTAPHRGRSVPQR